MLRQQPTSVSWANYCGPNLAYVQQQYELYLHDPAQVTLEFVDLFERLGPPVMLDKRQPSACHGMADDATIGETPVSFSDLNKIIAAKELIYHIRTYGHLVAQIDPLQLDDQDRALDSDLARFQLTEQDLKRIPASLIFQMSDAAPVQNAWQWVQKLHHIYTQSIGYEFNHVQEQQEREWLYQAAERQLTNFSLTNKEQKDLLEKLIEVDQFEDFLHKTFVGQKRFSIEGNDVLVPVLDEAIRIMVNDGNSNILIGMAHRGRLNVLAHVLEKPYEQIFFEFYKSINKQNTLPEDAESDDHGWTGDVKYHLGAQRVQKRADDTEAHITLANNPSHLEYVNAVVQGYCRAAQDNCNQAGAPVQDVSRAVTIVVHGDAAFPGEGMVAETLNLKGLRGYQTGGTLHIIVNNQLGFTTHRSDSRSTHYASDIAKGYEIPIVHVNADDPEACIAVIRMAVAYRHQFKKDFLIDLVGYRRYGHNETDDPETTQPLIYKKIKQHEKVSKRYEKQLEQESVVDQCYVASIYDQVQLTLKTAYEQMKVRFLDATSSYSEHEKNTFDRISEAPKHVSEQQLVAISEQLVQWPELFCVYPKLQRILERRHQLLVQERKVDWSLAETLAFATILAEGTPIRMTGQDSERATFAHRHLMLNDVKTAVKYCPLHHLSEAKASFAIHNSPLAEQSIVAFEYGYSVYSKETLVIWEAQFGDFSNCAQVIFDQFICAGWAKWAQRSSLVLLLPHGSEGQGPEHTSARLERFLQLAAEDNWMIINVSTAAQYFHILRHQAARVGTQDARPLVVMSPKSLIRHAQVVSPITELSDGRFETVLERPCHNQNVQDVERIVLCSGKVAVDLEEAMDSSQQYAWLHIVRVEQLYPFPEQAIACIFSKFPQLKQIVWLQEEPKNMGAWTFVEPRLRALAPKNTNISYIGRPERASPASGYQQVHLFEQQQLVAAALQKIIE